MKIQFIEKDQQGTCSCSHEWHVSSGCFYSGWAPSSGSSVTATQHAACPECWRQLPVRKVLIQHEISFVSFKENITDEMTSQRR